MARRVISNPALVAASAVALGAFLMQTAAHAQYGELLPQFSNTVVEPMRSNSNSRSVRMKLSQKNARAAQANRSMSDRPRTPRLGMAPKSFLRPGRLRRQDGDVFGEDQAGGGNPFGDAPVESPIQESPFAPYNPTLPDRNTPVKNPFGEPQIKTPVVDPAPRTPSMDTQPRPPRLPRGAEFTPEETSVPDLPTPLGPPRETDKARTQGRSQAPRATGRARIQRRKPNADDGGLEDFVEEDSVLVEEDSQPRRTPRETERRDRKVRDDDPRRPFRSNVYRPAPEPSYYVKPLEPGQYAPGPYAANADPNAANPYAANPYLVNPYAANPYAVAQQPPYPVPYPAPYAAAYAMNPYAGLGCPPACMGCQSCAPTNCCPPSNAYAGCPTPTPADCDDVYEPVVGAPAERARCGLGLNLCRRGSNSILTPTGVPLYYLSLFGGWSDLSDLEISNEEGTISLDSRNGVGIGAAFGQIQGRNLRSEFELTYRSHDIEDLFLSDLAGGSETLGGVGDVESYAGMFNVYWEFVDLLGGRLSPYIGAGVGAVNVTADMRLDGGTEAFQDGEDSSFAYQYMVGLNYKLREHSDLFIEYRHFAADSLRLNASLPEGSLLDGDGELDYRANNIFFGMRLKF